MYEAYRDQKLEGVGSFVPIPLANPSIVLINLQTSTMVIPNSASFNVQLSSLRSLKASSPEAVHAHHWYVSDPGDGGGSRLGPRPSLTALGQPLGSHTDLRVDGFMSPFGVITQHAMAKYGQIQDT